MAQRSLCRPFFAPGADGLGIRSASLIGQSEEARPGPAGTSDFARNGSQRPVGPSGVGEAFLLHRDGMRTAIPFTYQPRARSDLRGALNCYLLAWFVRLPEGG